MVVSIIMVTMMMMMMINAGNTLVVRPRAAVVPPRGACVLRCTGRARAHLHCVAYHFTCSRPLGNGPRACLAPVPACLPCSFMNSTLQCLAASAPLVQGLREEGHRKPATDDGHGHHHGSGGTCSVPAEEFCALCWATHFLPKVMHDAERAHSPAFPKKLANAPHLLGRQFRRGRQVRGVVWRGVAWHAERLRRRRADLHLRLRPSSCCCCCCRRRCRS